MHYGLMGQYTVYARQGFQQTFHTAKIVMRNVWKKEMKPLQENEEKKSI